MVKLDFLSLIAAYFKVEPNTIKKPVANPNRRTGVRKPVNIRARYWAYLFENLRRAVDEIYTTCEGDASVVECKVIRVSSNLIQKASFCLCHVT